jgi:hypothetical protein
MWDVCYQSLARLMMPITKEAIEDKPPMMVIVADIDGFNCQAVLANDLLGTT